MSTMSERDRRSFDAAHTIDEQAVRLMEGQPGLTYLEACNRVMAARPDLKQAYAGIADAEQDDDDGEDPGQAVIDRAETLMQVHDLSFAEATRLVLANNLDLARAYDQAPQGARYFVDTGREPGGATRTVRHFRQSGRVEAFGQTLKNIEIFKAGTWNGDRYTSADIDDMIAAYDEAGYVPPVKLGHDENPSAAAYGWVRNLRRQGDTLIADFADVPDDLVRLIKDGRYDAVSSEIFMGVKRNGQTFRRLLKAVAVLGAHPPAVSGLKPLRAALA